MKRRLPFHGVLVPVFTGILHAVWNLTFSNKNLTEKYPFYFPSIKNRDCDTSVIEWLHLTHATSLFTSSNSKEYIDLSNVNLVKFQLSNTDFRYTICL